MSETLSIEDQKRLTEWLGECWDYTTNTVELGYPTYGMWYCTKCERAHAALDFSDWRVIGRLIEKLNFLMLGTNKVLWGVSLTGEDGSAQYYAQTPQMAICRAVLGYLEDQV